MELQNQMQQRRWALGILQRLRESEPRSRFSTTCSSPLTSRICFSRSSDVPPLAGARLSPTLPPDPPLHATLPITVAPSGSIIRRARPANANKDTGRCLFPNLCTNTKFGSYCGYCVSLTPSLANIITVGLTRLASS